MDIPQELKQFQPSQQFQQALHQLNSGLVEAGQRSQKPISAQAALGEVMLPLFNLMSNYIKLSQLDTYRYFYGFCMYLHQQQEQAADDNIILAVDPDLADEVNGVTSAARETIGKTKAFIFRLQEYLAVNKPTAPPVDGGAALSDEEQAKHEANLEMHQALREESLLVMSALNDADEDLGIMADNVDSATYDPEGEGEADEGEADEGETTEQPPDDVGQQDETYESVVG